MRELIEQAIKAKDRAYVPYSKFRVGAALLTDEGEIYTGANIENAAYGPSVCAERVAIFKAVNDGKKKFKKIAITSDSKDTFPCGVCRQVMREFSPDIEIIIVNTIDDYKVYTLAELLPHSFGPDDLKDGKDV